MEHQKRKKLGLVALEKRLMLDASLPVIAGQIVWLDAADTSTILDAEGDNAASGASFSGHVTTWRDKSGSNYHVTTSASEQPDYGLNTLNGLGVITFNGTDDRLFNSSAVIAGNNYTMFVVFNRTTGTSRDAVFELGSGASRNGVFVNDVGSNSIGYYSSGSFSTLGSTYTPGTYTMLSVNHNNTSIDAWNGASNQFSGTTSARASTTGIYVGDDSTSGDQLMGNIAEIIVYDHSLTALERHDVENYLAAKWGLTETNTAPVITTNTGASTNQNASRIINSLMLSSSDADNSPSNLVYTITDIPDHGVIENLATGYILNVGDTFRQFHIDNGSIRYTHDNSGNFSDAFSFTVSDQYATTAPATFNVTIVPSNFAPSLEGWTQVSSEDFESGATGWSNNTTETGNAYLTRFLGRHSMEGGAQNTFKTYTLSGTQDYAVFTFDMYELDSWDGESFRIYIDDVLVYNQAFTAGTYNTPSDGSSGPVSWTIQELTPFNANFAYGMWADQIYRFTLTVDTSAAAVKIGFSSTLDQATNDEAWGIDNIKLYEVTPGGTPGPFEVVENAPNGTVVGRVTAYDQNVGDILTYTITGGTGVGIFAMNSSTGIITVINSAALNYESITSYTLDIRVEDNGVPVLFDTDTITINILDMPENTAPSVLPAGPFSVAENAAVNTVVGSVSGTDPEGNALTYSISGGNAAGVFAINATTGAIRIANTANLNYEATSSYTLTITATDNGFGSLTGSRNVTINITNVNEAPEFDPVTNILAANPGVYYNAATGNFYRFVSAAVNYATAEAAANAALLNGAAGHLATITSAAENTFVRGLISATAWLGGTDTTVEGEWRWTGGGAEAGQMFWLGGIGGSVQNGLYQNWVPGTQPDNSSNEDYLQMLTSGQWNDFTAVGTAAYVIEWEGAAAMATISNGPYTIPENSPAATSVGFAHATDPDMGDVLTYSITGGSGSGLFAINATTGEITLTGALNFEATNTYTLNLRVQDAGGLFDTTTVTINVSDVNETPVLNPAGPFSFNENTAPGTLVTTMTSSDPDGGQTRTYSIQSGNTGNMFAINATTGALTFAGSPDYENVTSYNLVIRVTDNGTGPLFAQQTVSININPLNEAPIFDPIQSVLALNPNLRYNATTGNFYQFIAGTTNLATARANSAAAMVNGIGGHLVTITSAAENNFVRNLITTGSAWLDASDAAVEGEWRWMSGPEAGQLFWLGTGSGSAQNGFYTNWNGGEPNNSSNEDGVQLFSGGGWNDINVGSSFSYVIEWEGAAVLASLQNGPYAIDENSAAGTSVGFAHSADPDAGDTRVYSITGGSGSSLFAINATTGEITLTGALNYESASSYTLNLRVQDVGGLFDTTTVVININDLNEVPVLSPAGPFSFNENVAPGTVVTNMSATDQDGGQTLTYTIQSGSTAGMFAINSATGQITFAGSPDFETVNSYSLVVRVTDNGTGALFAEQTVGITINDLNEVPVLSPAGPFSFNENVAPGTTVTTMSATDQDTADTLTYTIHSGNTGGMFAINSSTGEITFAGSPDFETLSLYNLVIRVTDNGTGSLFAQQTVTVNITDINEVPVLAPAGPFSFNENIAAGTVVTTMTATDQDGGQTLTYTIQSGNTGGMFTINSATGQITFAGSPDFETVNAYNLVVRVTDNGTGTLYAEQTVAININDLNEVPVLSPAGPFTVNENVAPGTLVTVMSATDQDAGQTLTYTIQSGNTGGMFAINASTGALTFAGSPNFEALNAYSLVIRVTDNGTGTLYAEQTVDINIADINDVPDVLNLSYNRVTENVPTGTVIGLLSTIDQDPTDTHTYSLITNPGSKFVIVGDELRTASNIDYEINQSFSVIIRTNDGNGGLRDRNFIIYVNDVMDTFIPPPTPTPPSPPVVVAPAQDMDTKSASLVMASLQGEAGQALAFYGMGDFHQILRENITFEIRDMASRQASEEMESFTLSDFSEGSVAQAGQADYPVQSDRFTNLREALKFFEQIKEAEKHSDADKKEATPQQDRDIPDNTIDRQFVDVLTYHEQKQQRLRDALKG